MALQDFAFFKRTFTHGIYLQKTNFLGVSINEILSCMEEIIFIF